MNDYFNKKKSSSGSNGGPSNGSKGPQMPKPPKMNINFGGKGSGVIYALIGFVLLMFLAKPYVIITEGERGILATNGKYEDRALLPGLHFIIPVFQKVYLVDTRVRIINYANRIERSATTGDGIGVKPAITVLDKRGLPVAIDLTVQYRLNAQFAAQTISNWGFSWEEKIINPVVRDVVRNVVGKYEAEALPTKRNEIADAIEQGVRKSIKSLKNTPAELQSVQLREIVLPKKVKEQIERVQLAKQQVQQAEQEVQKAKQDALKRAAQAQGNSDAVRIAAEGKAQAITIEAKAKAQANIIIAKSLTRNLLEFEQIKVQGKFNDALRVNRDAKIFLTPGGSTPNIWVDTKDAQKRVTSH